MKCVLVDGLLAFMKGLRVLYTYKLDTGAMTQRTIPLTTIATGQELPTSDGWRLVKRARQAMSHQRPRRRN